MRDQQYVCNPPHLYQKVQRQPVSGSHQRFQARGRGPQILWRRGRGPARWLIKYRETHAGTQSVATSAVVIRLKAVEKENQALRAEVSFLRKASAYFAREQRWLASMNS